MQNQNDPMTLTLLNLEIVGSLTAIIGLSLFIYASFNAKSIILRSYFNPSRTRQNLGPDVMTLIGRIFLVTGALIAASTTTMRLIQLTQKTTPIVFVTLGSWITFTGGVVALVGDYLRVQESSSTTPIY